MKVIGIGILLILLAVGGFFGCAFSTRNRIIEQNQAAEVSWSNVESAYQTRLDKIPNLVATVEGATKYEGPTLEKIVEKRNVLQGVMKEMKEARIDAKNPSDLERLDRMNSELLAGLRAFTGVAQEAYPQLKATESFNRLMDEISGMENRINVARRDYNQAVGTDNATIQKWGFLPFCGGWKERAVFKASEGAKEVPKVKF